MRKRFPTFKESYLWIGIGAFLGLSSSPMVVFEEWGTALATALGVRSPYLFQCLPAYWVLPVAASWAQTLTYLFKLIKRTILGQPFDILIIEEVALIVAFREWTKDILIVILAFILGGLFGYLLRSFLRVITGR